MYTTCVAQAEHAIYCTGTSTACEPKHAGLRTIGELRRLSMPITVRVQVQRTSPSTRAYARSVHRSGCSCRKLYVYKYSMRDQARGPKHNRCIAQAVHAKLRTSTVRTIGTSPKLFMPNTVRIQVQRASPSTRAYGRSVHRPGCPWQMLYGYRYSVRAQTRGPTPFRCIAQAVYAINCTCTNSASEPKHAGLRKITTYAAQTVHAMYCKAHAYTYARGVVQRPGCTCRPPYIHTCTYEIHCLGCPSRTPYCTYIRGKRSTQAPV